MELIEKEYIMKLSQSEINEIEATFFSLMSNYKDKYGHEGIEKFSEEHNFLYNFYLVFKYKTKHLGDES